MFIIDRAGRRASAASLRAKRGEGAGMPLVADLDLAALPFGFTAAIHFSISRL